MSSTAKTPVPRVGRPLKGEGDARIERMLEVATRMFVKDGYALTTVKRIASELRMSKNTIYARYPSKSDLFDAVVRRVANTPALMIVADHDDLPVKDGLRERAVAILTAAQRPEFQGLYRILLAGGRELPEIEAAFTNVFRERLDVPIYRYIESRPDANAHYRMPLERVAHIFMVTLNAYIFDYTMRSGGRVSTEQVERDADEAVDYFLHGVSRAAAPSQTNAQGAD